MLRVGLISDTHGLLRPEAVAALAGSDLLLHAGDVGGRELLEELGRIAPLQAVRGNTDTQPWARSLPRSRALELEGVSLLLHHGHLAPSQQELRAAGVVVQGHSHRPEIERREGRLLVNPGSAGPRRFRLPVSVARLHICGSEVEAELVELPSGG